MIQIWFLDREGININTEKKLKLWHGIILSKKRTERTEHQELNKPWKYSHLPELKVKKGDSDLSNKWTLRGDFYHNSC